MLVIVHSCRCHSIQPKVLTSIEITHTLSKLRELCIIVLENKLMILGILEAFQIFFASKIRYKLTFQFIHKAPSVLNFDSMTFEPPKKLNSSEVKCDDFGKCDSRFRWNMMEYDSSGYSASQSETVVRRKK